MKNKKLGFTLAEVLITLAIIGVVAALTLPTLMSNYRKKEVETKLQKFYATMQQAIKMSTVDNGPTTEWPTFGTGETVESTPEALRVWYNKYLAPYINTSSVNENENGGLEVIFLDGSKLMISYYLFDMSYAVRNCGGNCREGVDIFRFRLYPKSLVPVHEKNKYSINPNIEPYAYAWDGTIEGAKYSTLGPSYGCYEEQRALCTKLIQLNGWKIPDDYPYHF